MNPIRVDHVALVGLLALAAVSITHAVLSLGSTYMQEAADKPGSSPKPSIVLVHGAFADGSGWSPVIRILQKDGYEVTAVQNPLSSFAEDVATTKRLVDGQAGPVVVVGHSYGGAVITAAAADNSRVKALVFVAAFAPDVGEQIGAYLEKYPSPLGGALRPDSAGFAYVDRAAFHDIFAKDLSKSDTDVMAAAQKPANVSLFNASPTGAAWKSTPTWYVLTRDDQALNPELQRFYAKRAGAKTTEIGASHAVFISHPEEVAHVIEAAAAASTTR